MSTHAIETKDLGRIYKIRGSKKEKAVREMDSPFSFRCVNLTCFPIGAAEYLHSHRAHGHGY